MAAWRLGHGPPGFLVVFVSFFGEVNLDRRGSSTRRVNGSAQFALHPGPVPAHFAIVQQAGQVEQHAPGGTFNKPGLHRGRRRVAQVRCSGLCGDKWRFAFRPPPTARSPPARSDLPELRRITRHAWETKSPHRKRSVPPVGAKRWQAIARQNRTALTVVFVTRTVVSRGDESPQCDLRRRNCRSDRRVMGRLCD